jgi:hypothetical protein
MYNVEKPHVRSIEDGIRGIDVTDFTDQSTLEQYLKQYDIVGGGREVIIFQKPGEELMLKLFIINYLGYDWTESFVRSYLNQKSGYHGIFSIIRERLYDLEYVKPQHADYPTLEARALLVHTKIAAHNSVYRFDSRLTPPVNGKLCFQSVPIGFFTKFLNGRLPRNANENPLFGVHLAIDGGEALANNTLIEITNSASDKQIVDIKHFVPSDEIEFELTHDYFGNEYPPEKRISVSSVYNNT